MKQSVGKPVTRAAKSLRLLKQAKHQINIYFCFLQHQVNEDSAGIAEDLMNGDLYFVEHPDYPENKKERHAAVRRAENRLGEKSYNIFINNCETFVTEVLMPGYGHSKQVHKVAAVSASASASASAAILSFTSLGPATAKFMKTASPVFVDAFSVIIASIPEAESVLDIVEKLLEAGSLNPLETTTNNIGTIEMVQSTSANNIGRD